MLLQQQQRQEALLQTITHHLLIIVVEARPRIVNNDNESDLCHGPRNSQEPRRLLHHLLLPPRTILMEVVEMAVTWTRSRVPIEFDPIRFHGRDDEAR
jgi:hypothetical protein